MDFEKTFPIKRIDSFERIQKEIDTYGRFLCCQIVPYYSVLKKDGTPNKIIEPISIIDVDSGKTTDGEDIITFSIRNLRVYGKDLVFKDMIFKGDEIPYFETEPQLMTSLLNFGPLEIDEENNKLIDLIYSNGR